MQDFTEIMRACAYFLYYKKFVKSLEISRTWLCIINYYLTLPAFLVEAPKNYVCQGKTMNITCEEGLIHINYANYGRKVKTEFYRKLLKINRMNTSVHFSTSTRSDIA